ncbi:hypothetical protein [Bradymonas sediminis]|uniref:Uncharacterized protein n=1 Tax=Bradymonas sediminis TaxID=1548548 RepID=A0A2Z4FP91_9DELT|nr:hypothetical protein [Bradymonas sediminis]AWV90464.1 hypothetical protein DN745_14445 [Bradymonas sediminis]TDP72150.1 hypothetical protein DFR33_107132 [Bradymonas sediminis]
MKPSSADIDITPHHTSAHASQRVRPWLVALSCLLCLAYLAGCGTTAQQTQREPERIVGAPPSAEEDPFFVRGTPAEAERVEAQGVIEPDQPTDPAIAEELPEQPAAQDTPALAIDKPAPVAPTAPTETAKPEIRAEEPPRPEAPPTPAAKVIPPMVKPEKAPAITPPDEPKVEVAPRGELAAVVKPTPPKTRPAPPKSPEAPQCFSCVKICPLSGDCAAGDEDIICGWGTQKQASVAKKLAQAQCDATLDMARQMPVWSRIDGQCPPATCR